MCVSERVRVCVCACMYVRTTGDGSCLDFMEEERRVKRAKVDTAEDMLTLSGTGSAATPAPAVAPTSVPKAVRKRTPSYREVACLSTTPVTFSLLFSPLLWCFLFSSFLVSSLFPSLPSSLTPLSSCAAQRCKKEHHAWVKRGLARALGCPTKTDMGLLVLKSLFVIVR